jgi:hypothetical protein
MTAPTITEVRITAYPRKLLDPTPQVLVKYSDESNVEKLLFEFYPDEISFLAKEFLGLTEAQAKELKYQKDKAYLLSYARAY